MDVDELFGPEPEEHKPVYPPGTGRCKHCKGPIYWHKLSNAWRHGLTNMYTCPNYEVPRAEPET